MIARRLTAVLLLALGALFVARFVSDTREVARTQTWRPTECEAYALEREGSHVVARYRYLVDGKPWRAWRRWGVGDTPRFDRVGDRIPCHYDPADPRRHEPYPGPPSPWGRWALLGVGVVLGSLGAWKLVRPRASALAELFFPLPFLLVGLAELGFIGYHVADFAKQRAWVATTCLVDSTKTERDSDGDVAYRVRYRYERDGTVQRDDDRISFAQPPAGSTIPCWIAPTGPPASTLERKTVGSLLLLGGFLLVHGGAFFYAGLSALMAAIKGARPREDGDVPPERGDADERARPRREGGPARPVDTPPPLPPFELTADRRRRPVWWTLVVAGLAVLGNVLFLRAGGDETTVALALGLLVLALALVARDVLRWITPHPRLFADARTLVEGSDRELAVTLAGWIPRVRRLEVTLVGREELAGVPRRQHTFREDLVAMLAGREAHFALRVPGPPPFTDGTHALRWVLRVRADVAFWPDVDDELELRIAAPPTAPARRTAAAPDVPAPAPTPVATTAKTTAAPAKTPATTTATTSDRPRKGKKRRKKEPR